jgi:hypothetical protein
MTSKPACQVLPDIRGVDAARVRPVQRAPEFGRVPISIRWPSKISARSPERPISIGLSYLREFRAMIRC